MAATSRAIHPEERRRGMKIEKEHKKETLMNWKKEKLVDWVLALEHNNNVLHDTVDTQAENFKKMVERSEKEKIAAKKNGFLSGIEASKIIKWELESEEIERVLKEWGFEN